MSIESLTSKETITVQTEISSTGTSWGQTESFGGDRTLNCCVQELDSRERLDFQARGLNCTHQIFFSSDPSITTKNQIVLSNGRKLRVTGAYTEGRPGRTMLWVVLAEWVQNRMSAS